MFFYFKQFKFVVSRKYLAEGSLSVLILTARLEMYGCTKILFENSENTVDREMCLYTLKGYGEAPLSNY